MNVYATFFSDKRVPEHRDNAYPGDAKTFKVVVSAYTADSTENVKMPYSLSRNSLGSMVAASCSQMQT